MFMPYINLTGGGAQLTDLNGDGLIDYLYVTHQGDQFCLYLNTGTGWTPTFRCYIERTNPIRFYGDCADV